MLFSPRAHTVVFCHCKSVDNDIVTNQAARNTYYRLCGRCNAGRSQPLATTSLACGLGQVKNCVDNHIGLIQVDVMATFSSYAVGSSDARE